MMNFSAKYLLASLSLAIPAVMGAVSASPRVMSVTNPDGTVVQIRQHGNEFFNFMTDADASRILTLDDRGFYVDAVRNGKTLAFTEENVDMLRAEAYESSMLAMIPADSRQRMASLDSSGRSQYPTTGVGNRSLVVLVEFSDTPFTMDDPKDYYTRQLNEPGFSDYGGVGSAVDYYRAASNGLYVPQFDVLGPVRLDKPASYFYDSNDNNSNMSYLIKESLTQLHERGELNFADYDLDNDGVVDTVFFYYAGYGAADSRTQTIWPHQFDYRYYGLGSLSFDGKRMGPYACANELDGYNPQTNRNPWVDGSTPWVGGIGTFVHEYGHVLGLPDLYDVEYSGKAITPGEWDVMDQGSYNFNGVRPPLMSAYEQWVCRWLEYTTAEDETHYDLAALGNTTDPSAVRIRIPMSASGSTFQSEYFLIESRDNTGWDSCFPNPGLMVWRINFNRNLWNSNSVNSANGSNVEIIYANGNKRNPLYSSGAIYHGAPVELIPSKEYPYWVSPYITDISYDADAKTGSFDYNMVKPSDIATVLNDTPVAHIDGSRTFGLEWEPVEGVDYYRLTIRTVSNGKIIGDFDNKNMGKDTEVWVTGLSSVYWRLELEAFVTCVVDGMPSTATSNVVRFKPSELQRGGFTAVDGIFDDMTPISGGIGCVNAPDGARVFDLTGKELRCDALSPGIYVVRYGDRSVKVRVK